MNSTASSTSDHSEKTIASLPQKLSNETSRRSAELPDPRTGLFGNSASSIAGLDPANEQHDNKQQEAATSNELMIPETDQRLDRERLNDQQVAGLRPRDETSKTSETNETDESEAANGKSVSFDELPARGQSGDKSEGPAQLDELDYSEQAAQPTDGVIHRRAFLMADGLAEARNGTSRLASLIAHKPLGSGLRNLAKNSTVLRALEKRRLRQRERLKRIKLSKQKEPDKGVGLAGGNKKRDLEEAQTRQSLITSSTTLGPGPSLLTVNEGGRTAQQSNLSLKTNAFKHLPSLASSSTQISSAIQRLISGKLGLSGAANTGPNSDLTATSNQTNLSELVGRKQSNLFGGAYTNHLLQLSADLHDNEDQADFSATSASDQHQHSTLVPGRGNLGGSGGAHFDVLAASDDGQETDEAEQLNGDRLVELMQSAQWPPTGLADDQQATSGGGGLLGLQAAQRSNRLLAKQPNRGRETAAQSDKQTIPVEIIGLDPSVTNSILYGATNANTNEHRHQQVLYQNQLAPANANGNVNGQPMDENSNASAGRQTGQQLGSASELDIHENSPSSSQFANVPQELRTNTSSHEFRPDAQQVQKLELDSAAPEPADRPGPSSVLHVHHFHHTTEPDKTQPALGDRQQQEADAEQLDQADRQVGETSGEQTSELAGAGSSKALEAPSGEQANQSEVAELQQQQPAGEEKTTETKRMRFVTRNSLRDNNLAPSPTVSQHANLGNVNFLLQPPDDGQMSPGGRFRPIRPQQTPSAHAENDLQTFNAAMSSDSGRGNPNGMLMVAYRPAGRVRPSTSGRQLEGGDQRALELGPRLQKQPDFWSTSLLSAGEGNRSQMSMMLAADELAHQRRQPQTSISQMPAFNEASESSHLLLGPTNQVVQQQRQRLVSAAMAAAANANSTLRSQHQQVPLSIMSQPKSQFGQQHQQGQLIRELLKQPTLSPALLMQLRDKLSPATLALESAKTADPNWTGEDERLLSQYIELTSRRANSISGHRQQLANNLPSVINATVFNQQQLRPELQNPFQNHYQNFVENLVMMKRLRPKSEELPAQLSQEQAQLNSRLTNNELAAVMQEQLSKQTLNRSPLASLAPGDQLNNTASGRYELTMASDRAPAKLLQQQVATNTSLVRTGRPHNQTTFSANENFHVPNTSSRLPASLSPVTLTSRPIVSITSQPTTGPSAESNSAPPTKTGGFNATARPSLVPDNRESFMDSAEGVSNLALAFIFVVSLLTFILIAGEFALPQNPRSKRARHDVQLTNGTNLSTVSMVYRRRRSLTRCDPSRAGDGSRSSTGFSIAQRTRHLMRSNVFAGARVRPRASQQQEAQLPATSSTVSSANSSSSSLASIAYLNRVEGESGSVKTLNLDHRSNHHHHQAHETPHQTQSSAARSAWAKHLKPVLRRAPTLQPDVGRCKVAAAAAASCLQQQSANLAGGSYASKYVRGQASNLGNTFDVSRRRQTEAPSGGPGGGQSDKYHGLVGEAAISLTNDGTLVSNPDSDIRTLNTRLQRAHLQHDLRQDSPAKQPAAAAAVETQCKKQHQVARRAH